MNSAIHPAVEEMIGTEQQGFLLGRLIDNHVLGINEDFYGAMRRGNKLLVLFLDNIKAFDSIEHEFLFKIIERMGFPKWVTLFIKGLFHSATVEPSFGQKGHYSIPISRGVKQGCPLSPTLFILAIEALINNLRKIPGIRVRAFADDIAISTPDPSVPGNFCST